MIRSIGLALVVVALIAASACGGDDNAPPTETPVSTATPSAEATSTSGGPLEVPPLQTFDEFQATGLAADLPELVVEVIEAALGHDTAAIEDLVSWELRPCATNWTSGPPSPPKCDDGQADGTEVESVEYTTSPGETSYVSKAAFQEQVASMMDVDWGLCRVRDVADPAVQIVDMRYPDPDSPEVARDWRFTVDEAGITAVAHSTEFPGEWQLCDIQ